MRAESKWAAHVQGDKVNLKEVWQNFSKSEPCLGKKNTSQKLI